MFVVRPPGSAGNTGNTGNTANKPQENLAETIPPGGAVIDATRRARIPLGMSEENEAEKTTDGPPADDTRPWKLRLGGLTYAFHSKDSLQQWLVTRENLEGVKLMREGEAWRSLDEMPELLTPQIKLKLARAGAAGSSDASAASERSAQQGGGAATSPFSSPPEDELAKARAAPAGGAAAAAARKTLSGLQAVAPPPPSPSASPKRTKNPDQGKGARPAAGKAGKLAIIFVVLLASTATLHALGVINLGVLIPELDNRKQTSVIQGTPKKRTADTAQPTAQGLDPTQQQLPPTTIVKVPGIGEALQNVKQETPEERQARLADERTQIPKLLDSQQADDWKKAEKILTTSLLEEFPEDEGLWRSLVTACTKTNNAGCQQDAQAKVDAFVKREQDRVARIARLHQDAQQKLQTKKPGDAGAALLLVRSLLETDPESVEYNTLLVEAYKILNQDADREKAQAHLDTLLVAQGLRNAKAHLAEGHYDEAIEVLEKDLLKRDAQHPEFLTLVIEAYNKRGGKKDLKAAAKYQKILDKVKASNP